MHMRERDSSGKNASAVVGRINDCISFGHDHQLTHSPLLPSAEQIDVEESSFSAIWNCPQWEARVLSCILDLFHPIGLREVYRPTL